MRPFPTVSSPAGVAARPAAVATKRAAPAGVTRICAAVGEECVFRLPSSSGLLSCTLSTDTKTSVPPVPRGKKRM